MQECCIFLNAFPPPDSLTPPGPNKLYGGRLKAPLCKGGSAGRRWGIVTLRKQLNSPTHAPIPPSRLRRATSLYTREALRWAVGGGVLDAPGNLRNRKLPLTTPLNQALSVSFLQRVHRNLSKISHRRPRFCRQTGRSARACLLFLSSRVSQNEIFMVSSQENHTLSRSVLGLLKSST